MFHTCKTNPLLEVAFSAVLTVEQNVIVSYSAVLKELIFFRKL